MQSFNYKVAAITGAGSGIGRALAYALARRGCDLALSDINAGGMAETAAQAKKFGIKVSERVVDVSDRLAMHDWAEAVLAEHGKVNMIFNNAGVAHCGTVADTQYADYEWLMGINFWGVVYGTMAFLPYLKQRPEGHVVNISSINGILPNPNNGPYCAAKFAVKGYTETLAQEMHGTKIRVSCVHPGGIKTNIARSARINKALYSLPRERAVKLYEEELFRTTADEAARVIIAGIKAGRRRILVGNDARVIDLLARLFPVAAVSLSGWMSRYLVRRCLKG